VAIAVPEQLLLSSTEIMSIAIDTNIKLVSTASDMNSKRSYDNTKRAEGAVATRERILQAGLDLAWEQIAIETTLEHVATRAGVSVKTVLRHFGSRDGFDAALEQFALEGIGEERAAPVGDVAAAVHAIFNHYERRGDGVLKMLGQELFDDNFREGMDTGRRMHRDQIAEVFAPQLRTRLTAEREALIDLLVVATDVYTWKLLRRDRGLDQPTTEARVRQLIAGILGTSTEGA
jgi:AcrR family transcriptional regulator